MTSDLSLLDTFGFRLVMLGRAWRREVDEALAAFGLSEATWRPMLHLARLGDGVRQTDLAEALGIEAPSLVRLLDTLAASGLVERRDDAADRRVKTVHLTRNGREIMEAIRAVACEVNERIRSGVLDDEIADCLRVFERMERNIAASRKLRLERTARARAPRREPDPAAAAPQNAAGDGFRPKG